MFVLGNFISAFANLLNILITVLWWVIVIRALISWVNPDPNNAIVQLLYKVTEPFLEPVRRLLPFSFRFGLDVSPLIVLAILYFLRLFLVPTLLELAYKLH
ncbi:MAG: YggT family protein [Deltaproteobacteria bacterium]